VQFYQTPFPYGVALQIINKARLNLLKIVRLAVDKFCILRTGAAASSFPAGQDTDTTPETPRFNTLSAGDRLIINFYENSASLGKRAVILAPLFRIIFL
jgi:hypothetical protein